MNNQSTVYLNKVFSDLRINSCPIMSALTVTSECFDQQLTFFDPSSHDDCDCNCGCCTCNCNCNCNSTMDLDGDLNFVVDSTEAIISDFDLTDPSSIQPCNVTVDGIPVDDLDFFNERYMAATNDLMTKVGDCACMERGLSTKTYFLIAGICDFRAKLTIVLRGSVFGCGTCKKFKLLMSTKNNVFVNIPGTATFATADLCLPCTTGGIAPIINFSFGAQATLLNPVIKSNRKCGTCDLTVTGCLVAEPFADVQVTRQTLFRTNAQTVNVPCDDLARCKQQPGVCGDEDDDSNAVSLRNRCCEDSANHWPDEDCASAGCGCANEDCASAGCGCANEDCGCDSGHTQCGCGNTASITVTTGTGCGCGGSARSGRNTPRSITCQFNGRNGCSF